MGLVGRSSRGVCWVSVEYLFIKDTHGEGVECGGVELCLEMFNGETWEFEGEWSLSCANVVRYR